MIQCCTPIIALQKPVEERNYDKSCGKKLFKLVLEKCYNIPNLAQKLSVIC